MSVLGLPLHPLVVHIVVVLLPLGAVSMAMAVLWRAWATRFAAASVGLLTVSGAALLLARSSGEALAGDVGTPVAHVAWADRLTPVAIALWVAAIAWWVLRGRRPVASLVTGAVVVVVAIATTVLTVLVGHSGAEATWAGSDGRVQQAGTATVDREYTMEQVARHGDAVSCWTVVEGDVYDVTTWIGRHPGGAANIEQLCGRDGTDTFRGQHGEAQRPSAALADHRVGTLVD